MKKLLATILLSSSALLLLAGCTQRVEILEVNEVDDSSVFNMLDDSEMLTEAE